MWKSHWHTIRSNQYKYKIKDTREHPIRTKKFNRTYFQLPYITKTLIIHVHWRILKVNRTLNCAASLIDNHFLCIPTGNKTFVLLETKKNVLKSFNVFAANQRLHSNEPRALHNCSCTTKNSNSAKNDRLPRFTFEIRIRNIRLRWIIEKKIKMYIAIFISLRARFTYQNGMRTRKRLSNRR